MILLVLLFNCLRQSDYQDAYSEDVYYFLVQPALFGQLVFTPAETAVCWQLFTAPIPRLAE